MNNYLFKDLGNGLFVLYHPMLPNSTTVEQLYGTNLDHIYWCLYVARGGTERRHCIDPVQNRIEVSVFVPFMHEWHSMTRTSLLVPSRTPVRFEFYVNGVHVTKEVSFFAPNS